MQQFYKIFTTRFAFYMVLLLLLRLLCLFVLAGKT